MRHIQTLFLILLAVFLTSNLLYYEQTVLQLIEVGLQCLIGSLTYAHLHVQQRLIQFQQSEPCSTVSCKMSHTYNLSQYEHECPDHRYNVRFIHRRPLIVYIEQFLTENEIQHLIELANPLFERSTVDRIDGTSSFDDYRTSASAFLNRSQTHVVKCIEQRFAQFQGDIDVLRIEPLQIVKYGPDQQYKPHYDWFDHPDYTMNGGDRITTFFTYLQANCSGGETEFVNITFNASLHSCFCDILTCDAVSPTRGIRFRPIPGNSLFWFNLDEQQLCDESTMHAGLPPGEGGQKIGLNTWTRESLIF